VAVKFSPGGSFPMFSARSREIVRVRVEQH
jgi:hypothetical protein